MPLVCCNNCSGVPLPTGPGGVSGFSLFRRSAWLRGLVVLEREKDNDRVKVLQCVCIVNTNNRKVFTRLIINTGKQSLLNHKGVFFKMLGQLLNLIKKSVNMQNGKSLTVKSHLKSHFYLNQWACLQCNNVKCVIKL